MRDRLTDPVSSSILSSVISLLSARSPSLSPWCREIDASACSNMGVSRLAAATYWRRFLGSMPKCVSSAHVTMSSRSWPRTRSLPAGERTSLMSPQSAIFLTMAKLTPNSSGILSMGCISFTSSGLILDARSRDAPNISSGVLSSCVVLPSSSSLMTLRGKNFVFCRYRIVSRR